MRFLRTRNRVAGRPVFKMAATPTGVYRKGALRTTGFIRPNYRPLFEGLETVLRREMSVVLRTTSRSSIRELEAFIKRAGKAWLVSPQPGKRLSEPHYRIMECWGL